MALKTVDQYLESLRDGRTVYYWVITPDLAKKGG